MKNLAAGFAPLLLITTQACSRWQVEVSPPVTHEAHLLGPEAPISQAVPVALPLPGGGISGSPAVVWLEGLSLTTWASLSSVVGHLRREDGTFTEPGSFEIASSPSLVNSVAVAGGQGTFLVAWTAPSPATFNTAVWAARVSREGTVLDPGGFQVSTDGAGSQSAPQVMFDGTRFLVLWTEGGSVAGPGPYIAARHVTLDGTPLEPEQLHYVDSSYARLASQPLPALLWTQSYDAGFSPGYNLRASMFDSLGALTVPAGVVMATGLPVPSGEVATSPGGALVFWSVTEFLGPTTQFARSLLGDGGVGSAQAFAQSADNRGAASAWDGRAFYTLWHDGNQSADRILSGTLNASGVNLTPDGGEATQYPPLGELPVVTPGPSRVTLTRAPPQQLWVVDRFADGGPPSAAEAPVSTRANDQQNPTLLFDGTGYTAFWQDNQSGKYQIMTRRFDVDGQALDDARAIAQNALTDNTNPSAALSDGHFMVAWQGSDGLFDAVFAVRVEVDGTPGALPPVRVSTQGNQAQNGKVSPSPGGGFLVAFDEGPQNSEAVLARRLDPSGTPLDVNPFRVSDGMGINGEHIGAATWDGTQHVVVFGAQGTFLTRVSAAGVVSAPILLTPLASFGAAVASDGTRLLILVGKDRILSGVFWRPPDTVEQLDIPAAHSYTSGVSATYDGLRFQFFFSQQGPLPGGTYARWVLGNGEVTVVRELVTERTHFGGGSAAASAGQTRVMVAYAQDESGVRPNHSNRIYIRTMVNGLGNGAACTADSECHSNQCREHVCTQDYFMAIDAGVGVDLDGGAAPRPFPGRASRPQANDTQPSISVGASCMTSGGGAWWWVGVVLAFWRRARWADKL